MCRSESVEQIGLFITVNWDIFELTFVVWAQYASRLNHSLKKSPSEKVLLRLASLYDSM